MHLTVGYLATPIGGAGVALASAIANSTVRAGGARDGILGGHVIGSVTAAVPTLPGDDDPSPFALTLASAANRHRVAPRRRFDAQEAELGRHRRVGGGLQPVCWAAESSWAPPQLVFWRVQMRQLLSCPATTPEDA